MSPQEDRTRDAVDSEPKHYQRAIPAPPIHSFQQHWSTPETCHHSAGMWLISCVSLCAEIGNSNSGLPWMRLSAMKKETTLSEVLSQVLLLWTATMTCTPVSFLRVEIAFTSPPTSVQHQASSTATLLNWLCIIFCDAAALSHSKTHTHTHTHTLSLSLSLTHTHTHTQYIYIQVSYHRSQILDFRFFPFHNH